MRWPKPHRPDSAARAPPRAKASRRVCYKARALPPKLRALCATRRPQLRKQLSRHRNSICALVRWKAARSSTRKHAFATIQTYQSEDNRATHIDLAVPASEGLPAGHPTAVVVHYLPPKKCGPRARRCFETQWTCEGGSFVPFPSVVLGSYPQGLAIITQVFM
jgi:hypothetical protein